MTNAPIVVDEDTLQAIARYGGTFAQQLGNLYRVADPANQSKLRATFADLFRYYRDVARGQKGTQ